LVFFARCRRQEEIEVDRHPATILGGVAGRSAAQIIFSAHFLPTGRLLPLALQRRSTGPFAESAGRLAAS
jgi:hypothetical protein